MYSGNGGRGKIGFSGQYAKLMGLLGGQCIESPHIQIYIYHTLVSIPLHKSCQPWPPWWIESIRSQMQTILNRNWIFWKTSLNNTIFLTQEIHRVINSGQGKCVKVEEEVIKGLAIIRFCRSPSNCITLILTRQNIKTITRPYMKMRDLMSSVKDPLGLWVPVVYQTPFACGEVYVGQMGRTITIRQQEHKSHLRLGNIENQLLPTMDGTLITRIVLRTLCSSTNQQIGKTGSLVKWVH